MTLNTATTDSEWNPRTGEFFCLGVKFGNKPSVSYDRNQMVGRKIKVEGHTIVYYFYAVRDIEAFLMKFEGSFEFRDVYHVLRLTQGTTYSNKSSVSESKMRVPKLHQIWQSISQENSMVRDDKHVYLRYDKALLRLVRHDVEKLKDVVDHFKLSTLEIQDVIHKWSANSMNYISTCKPVQMEKSYLDRINSPAFLQRLVNDLEEDNCRAFTVKTIVGGAQDGLPTLSANRKAWMDYCELKGWTEFLKFEKRQDGKERKYARMHKDDFMPSIDMPTQVRSTESGASDIETLIHLVTIIRTGHTRFPMVVPLVHPHHTATGRSGQLISPYVAGGLVRSNIYAGDGRAIVSVDLKSQEFCIAAASSDCEGMWKLAEHDDPYMQLADLFNVDPATATKGGINRDKVKVPILQMLYGGGARLVFQNLEAFSEERRWQMAQLKDRFPMFFQWNDEQVALGEERGYMELPDGFKLWLESDTMNPRQCSNFLIQGRAASIMPLWMSEVNKVIPKTAYISAELYDGLYVNCQMEDVDTVIESLVETSTVWDKEIPLHRDWICEIVGNKETGEPFHVHGVKEKAKYLAMDKVFEKVGL